MYPKGTEEHRPRWMFLVRLNESPGGAHPYAWESQKDAPGGKEAPGAGWRERRLGLRFHE